MYNTTIKKYNNQCEDQMLHNPVYGNEVRGIERENKASDRKSEKEEF